MHKFSEKNPTLQQLFRSQRNLLKM